MNVANASTAAPDSTDASAEYWYSGAMCWVAVALVCAGVVMHPTVLHFLGLRPTPSMAGDAVGIAWQRLMILAGVSVTLGLVLRHHAVARRSRGIPQMAMLPLVVGLVGAEIALRIFVPQRGEWLERDLELGFQNRPGFYSTPGGRSVQINAFGLRGPEIDLAKAHGVTRILFTGDSTTFGHLLQDHTNAYPHLTGQMLARQCGRPIEALNAGVGGYEPWQQVRWIRRHGLALAPDLIVPTVNMGDFRLKKDRLAVLARARHPPEDAMWAARLIKQSALWQWSRRIQARVSFLPAAGVEGAHPSVGAPQIFLNPDDHDVRVAWRDTLADLRELFQVCRDADVPVVLLIYPLRVQFTANVDLSAPNQRLAWFAQQERVPIVDLLALLRPRLVAHGADPWTCFANVDHFNELGSLLAAEELARALQPFVPACGTAPARPAPQR